MIFSSGPDKSLDDTKKALVAEFNKPKLESHELFEMWFEIHGLFSKTDELQSGRLEVVGEEI